jgi:hypothetical protein
VREGLPKTEDGEEGFVDAPELFGRNVTDELAQSGCIHGSHLFDQDPGDLSFDIDLRPEGRRSSASGGRGYKDDGPGQQVIGLHDDTKPPALLLVPPA